MDKLINKKIRPTLFYGSLLLLLFAVSFLFTKLSFDSRIQTDRFLTFQAITGSVAPFGESESLFLDSSGHGLFMRTDAYLDSTLDSVVVDFTGMQIRSLLDTLSSVGYFELDTLYFDADTLTYDGSAIFLICQTRNLFNKVIADNESVPEVDRIILAVNEMLRPYNVKLTLNN